MRLKKARQIIKALADDNRLRIINLLSKRELNVAELCDILRVKQSNVSRHLARLRLTGLVGDNRKGQFVYYYLVQPKEKFHKDVISCIINNLSDLSLFKQDLEALKEISNK